MKSPLVFLPTLALAGPLALEQRQVPARLVSVAAWGEGCPAGSFSTLISEAAQSAKASFDNFVLRAGQGVALDNKSIGCDVAVTVSFPGTCKRAVMKTTTDGSVSMSLGAGTTAVVATRFRVSSGGRGDEAAPALIYSSFEDRQLAVDIGRNYDVSIEATSETATFTAHLQLLLNAPDATRVSEAALDGFGLVLSQDGLC